jgi:mycothiol maleylpyruvate isomerase-like protein
MLSLHVQETAQVGRLVRDADLTAPVPSCPGWSVYDLVIHLGAVHRRAAGGDAHAA